VQWRILTALTQRGDPFGIASGSGLPVTFVSDPAWQRRPFQSLTSHVLILQAQEDRFEAHPQDFAVRISHPGGLLPSPKQHNNMIRLLFVFATKLIV
jgi:hypothetical protein